MAAAALSWPRLIPAPGPSHRERSPPRQCYPATGETRRPIQDFDQAVSLDRDFAEAFLNRGEIYHSARRYDRALAGYSEAIRLNPTDAYSLYSRGLIQRAMGNEVEAKTDIAKAKEIEPEIGPRAAACRSRPQPGFIWALA